MCAHTLALATCMHKSTPLLSCLSGLLYCAQVALAAEFQRPVSVHCVKGYGHLLDFFASLSATPEACPPKVMLHSYGGSVEEIPRFCKLRGIGTRFYFSFSHAINHRTPEKLRVRVAAVPDDRLLLESDQVGCAPAAIGHRWQCTLGYGSLVYCRHALLCLLLALCLPTEVHLSQPAACLAMIRDVQDYHSCCLFGVSVSGVVDDMCSCRWLCIVSKPVTAVCRCTGNTLSHR